MVVSNYGQDKVTSGRLDHEKEEHLNGGISGRRKLWMEGTLDKEPLRGEYSRRVDLWTVGPLDERTSGGRDLSVRGNFWAEGNPWMEGTSGRGTSGRRNLRTLVSGREDL